MKNNEKNVVVLYEPNNSKEKINFFKKMTSAEEQGPPLMDVKKFGKLGKYTLTRKYPLSKSESAEFGLTGGSEGVIRDKGN